MTRLVAVAAALLLLATSSAADSAAPAQPHTLMGVPLAAASAPPPDGPAIPTIQDGIGPGSGMRQGPTPGDVTSLCTAAFLLRDPATATYYLSTAGHCLVRDEADPTPYTGAANPDKVNQEIDVCVSGCIDNALGLGTYVKITPKDGWQPVTFAQSGGPGQDFGIVEIPAAFHNQLRPWMPQFGGPTGYDPSVLGDTLVHYGHGTYCCPVAGGVASRTPVDQGRVGTSLGVSGNLFSAVGSSTGGDSGSGVAIGLPDAGRGIQGGAAVGVLTHGLQVSGVPYFVGTVLAHGLAMVREATGLNLELVLQDDPLTTVPVPQAAGRVAIHTPVAGATVRPGGDGLVQVAGSAGLGNATPPPGALVQLAVDDAEFGAASRVPVFGNASWSAQWDLHGVPLGPHRLYARLVGGDGATLAAVNQTVTVAAQGKAPATGTGAPNGPGATPSGASKPGAGGASSTTKKSPMPSVAIPAVALLALVAAARRRR